MVRGAAENHHVTTQIVAQLYNGVGLSCSHSLDATVSSQKNDEMTCSLSALQLKNDKPNSECTTQQAGQCDKPVLPAAHLEILRRLDESKRDVDWLIDEYLDYKDKAAYEQMQYKRPAARESEDHLRTQM